METTGQPRTRAPRLFSLPTTVLEGIFARIDLRERVSVLPLVCTAFRRMLRGSSACLWPEITFDADISIAEQRTKAHDFLAWLREHGQHSRTLQLDLWGGDAAEPLEDNAAHRLLEHCLHNTLAATLHSCEFLRLRWGGDMLVVGDWVAAATSVTCLALSGHMLRVKSSLSRLTNLVHLELSTVEDMGPYLEPGCLPPSITRLCCVPAPAENLGEADIDGDLVLMGGARANIPEQALSLPHLVYLDVSESLFAAQHLTEALPRLTRLSSLAFDKCELPGGLPRELSLLTCLRVLSFDGCPLHGELEFDEGPPPPWTVLTSLSRLVSLSISNCRLAHFPEPLTGVNALQHLYLEHNSIRVLPPGPYIRSLAVLSTDWEPLLRSYSLLMEAPRLRKLALGSQSVNTHNAEGLPPLAEVPQLMDVLRTHPGLQQILLVARGGHIHGAICVVLEAMLSLRGVRQGLDVRPIQHDAFFVEEPPPDEQEDTKQQQGQGQGHEQQQQGEEEQQQQGEAQEEEQVQQLLLLSEAAVVEEAGLDEQMLNG